MKRQKITLIILSLCLLLTGCGTKYTTTEEAYVPEEDYQYQYFLGFGNNPLTESETGYYFILGNYIHYMDKETMQPVVLCQKPSCLHDQEDDPYIVADCNAFMRAEWIQYYNGKLYIVAQSLTDHSGTLYEISIDGSERKALYQFEYYPSYLALHRGNLYFSGTFYADDSQAVYSLNQMTLASAVLKPKIIYEGMLSEGGIFQLQPYRNRIFFTEDGIMDDTYKQRTVEYNCLTEEITVYPLKVEYDGKEHSSNFWGFYDGKLMESWSTPVGDDYKFRYWYYDPQTGEREECLALPQKSYHVRHTDGIYFYQYDGMETGALVGMYDKDGKLLAEFPMPEDYNGTLIPGNKLLFVVSPHCDIITAYDKSELVKGIVNPIQVLDVDINDYAKSVITTVE